MSIEHWQSEYVELRNAEVVRMVMVVMVYKVSGFDLVTFNFSVFSFSRKIIKGGEI